ncbi:Protein TIME FOR COFFEE [Quillaja saponaria]|uniref:Protein TIME FOR COFFEE n=1 Tax=Quillaja saponaria TaxID=32244 RepID=A0AAD7VEM2_QUISA|nr:Protein TIME FOR COFFEE [Quillaja saponaria]
MTGGNGFPIRRYRTTGLRDSNEEGQLELQEAVRLRDRRNKRGKDRDRDRDSLSRSKRRRGSHREEWEESTEESVGNEDEYEVEDAGVARMLSPNTASSASDQNHRRRIRQSRPLRHAPPVWNVADEMIGASVPRRTRSASAKRSHENWASASGGGEEQNSQQPSNSPAMLSVEAASPSSSHVSLRKKMKTIEPKALPPKEFKSPSSTQEDIEIEVAEVLFGLMTSKKHDSVQKLELNDTNGDSHDSKVTVSSQIGNSTLTNPQSYAPEKKVEDDKSSTPVLKSEQQPKEETSAPDSAKISGLNDNNIIGGTNLSEALKEDIKRENLDSVAGSGVIADENSLSSIGESPSCSKLDDNGQDSAETKAISAVPESDSQPKKLDIDLMAPPPMALLPERDYFSMGDFISESKPVAELQENTMKVIDNMEIPAKEEKITKELEKTEMVREKQDVLKLDLERQFGKQEQQPRNTNLKGEKPGWGSVPLPKDVAGLPSGLPPSGYVPPFQTGASMDGIGVSPAALQPPHFILSQPRPQRSATHHYIARNIFLHQQSTKMNHVWPAIGSASLSPAKPNNLNGKSSTENTTVRNQVQRSLLDMNLNHAPQKGWAATNFPGLPPNRNLDASNSEDAAHRKQLLLQECPQAASSDGLGHGPTFLFPMSHHQAPVATANNQSGAANSTNNASLSVSSAAGSLGTSSALPAVAATVSFSYPNFAASEAPYLAVVQNNGYPFPYSPVGSTPPIRGGSSSQATSIFNSPFYPSQMLRPSQLPRQQPHSRTPIQPTYQNTSTANSSSCHKQPNGAHVLGNNILTSTSMQLQQPQKQQVSLPLQSPKLENELSGENTPSTAGRTSYSQKRINKQDFAVPVQPQNFSFRASTSSGSVGGGNGNYGEKQAQQQQKQPQHQAVTGGVNLIPSQQFSISFAAFNATSMPSSLNFSSMAQSPVIFQSLPDMGRKGCQVIGTSETTQQKHYSISEGKTGGNSNCADDEKKAISGKLSTTGPTTLVFDNSAGTLNFISSPVTGIWPSYPITSTAITTNAPFTSNTSSSQQTHVFQLPKQQIVQQQQPTMAVRNKALTTNTASSSTKLSTNTPIFSETLMQRNSFIQSPQVKTSERTLDSQIHHTSLKAPTMSTQKNVTQQQGSRALEGHMQISFGGNPKSAPSQGKLVVASKQPSTASGAGTQSSGGNLKLYSQGRQSWLIDIATATNR